MRDSRKRERKMRNFLIRPGLQFKFSIRIALAALTLSCLNILCFYLYLMENYKIFVDPNGYASQYKVQTMDVLQGELIRISIILFVFSLIFVGISFLTGIILSHQIAGPMVAFKRTFSKIKEGHLSARINLRSQDEFKDIAGDFNNLMDDLETKLDSDQAEEADKDDKLKAA